MARILAVDDSRLIRDMVNTILSAEGHEVITADDGTEGLERARDEVFDLVLSDINMPNMNGISMISKMRRLPGYEFTPIVMVTTEDADYRKNKARNFGATGWLVKPFTPERLINAVSKLTN
ncbi:response regulator [Sulfuriflexus mobilis]|uniref:response regulator n=1 Tax=Sulfuriflexus mobilis TaxID=1811807 RepID=UPI000F8291F8|nr:response regulator [Sulfuriflexus mobilis]